MGDEKRQKIDRLELEIRCEHCRKWFRSWFGITLQRCPHCGRTTGCNKANMRLITGDKKFT
ncbi:MAG TPA: hypothetical protein ENI27_07640 [bacterium]|nr:hypothetical protein [bacterium]